MSDDVSTGSERNLRVLYHRTQRKRRIHLPPLIRHLIVAALGTMVAALSSYGLRKLGY